jgi:hypothetical protein
MVFHPLMSGLGGILVTVLVGLTGWLAILLVGRPIRDFLDLRREVRRRMLQFANLPVLQLMPGVTDNDGSLADSVDPRIREARQTFRDFGSQMRSFAETEYLASWVLGRFGIDPFKAGEALFGLAHTLSKNSDERRVHRKDIEAALRIKRQNR